MKNSAYILNIFAIAFVLVGCQKEKVRDEGNFDDGLYIIADLGPSENHPDDPKNVLTKVSYSFSEGNGDNWPRIVAKWEESDIIKVYPTGVYGESIADVYPNYEAYRAAYPYPAAPTVDKYYRFRCVGGAGTTHGVFKYIGLATATIVEDPLTNIRNVDVEITQNHKIPNWDRFQGVVVYGNPLRNIMMRHQIKDNDMTHIKYGQRMYGYMCAHNFQWWFDEHDQATDGAGTEGLVMRNIGSCVYRFILGNFDRDIYGGAVLSVSVPGITDDQVTEDKYGNKVRNQPMSVTLGDINEHQSGMDPWCVANTDGSEHTEDNTITAYIVGWPGVFRSGTTMTVSLEDPNSKTIFTWRLKPSEDIVFNERSYITFDMKRFSCTKTPMNVEP